MSKYVSRGEAVNHALIFDNSNLDDLPLFTWQDDNGWHCIDFSQIEFVRRFPDDVLDWFRCISKRDFRKVVYILRGVMKLQHFRAPVFVSRPEFSDDGLPF